MNHNASSPMRRALSAAIALAATLGVAPLAHAQAALDEIVKTKKIAIAVPTDFPPYGFVGPDLKPQGLDIDMANFIAGKLGATPELVPVTTANRIPYLQTKKAHLVVSTLGKNPEREKVIDFTAAYSPFFIAVFAPKGTAIKAPSDLAGKTIGVTRGSIDDQELTKVAPPNAEIRRFEDNNGTLSAYIAGQVQTIATSVSVANTIMQRSPQLGTEMKFQLRESPNFVGVAKGEDKLRERVNQIILEAKKSGELDKLAQKWRGRPPRPQPA
jgi:polar amino acid transport system substrate-binding protein